MSRGDFLEWVMDGKYPSGVIPLYVGALDIQNGPRHWIINWWGNKPLINLDNEGWFNQGHGLEGYLWSPPPEVIETEMKMIT